MPRTTTNHYQEESKPRRTPRRGVESSVRGFRDRDDGPVHSAMADEQQRQDQKAVGGYFKDPTGTSKMVGTDMVGAGEILRGEQGQHGAAEGAIAEIHREVPKLTNAEPH